MGLRGPCVRVGGGFGGFLGLREKVLTHEGLKNSNIIIIAP
jgi:hypothetical protein